MFPCHPEFLELYHVPVHPLAQQLLSHIRQQELLSAGDRVGVAVSGGIDSVALLRLLLELRFELGIVLSVVHFNHNLRGAESDADEEFVRTLAREHDLEFYVDCADVGAYARENGVSIETAARELRYEFFRSLIRGTGAEAVIPTSRKIGETGGTPYEGAPQGLKPTSQEAPLFHGDSNRKHISGVGESRALSNLGSTAAGSKLDKIATGHTLDDQAETVLMRIIRGAGMRGLGAIYPRVEVEDDDGEHGGEIVRPLLGTRRCELEGYLRDIDQSWREDSTNADHHFTRNRVRKVLLPLIEKEFNPRIAEGLAELAEIAREEEDYWDNEVAGWMGTAVHWSSQSMGTQNPHFWQNRPEVGHPPELVQIQPSGPEGPSSSSPPNASIDRLWFLAEPIAVQRRLVKAVAEEAGIPLEFKHVEEILRFAAESEATGKELALPLGWKLLPESAELVFLAPNQREQSLPKDYEYSLPVPGSVAVGELGSEFEAQIVDYAGKAGSDLDGVLDPESLAKSLTIRNWRAGDRFWPAHTKVPRKIKELLTDLHVPKRARASWPVVASGEEIVWVRGLPVSAKHRATRKQRALLIRETPFSDGLEK
jgi:tRNA(Ile)-lysidine synthase